MITMETQPQATSTLWRVDPDLSVVDFTARTFWGLVAVRGRFDRFDGWYEMWEDGGSIELTVDVQSIDTGNRTRDRHLRSADFFNVAEHPLMRFASTEVRDPGDGTLRVEGGLEAAGTIIPIEFDATVRWIGDEFEMEAATVVDHRGLRMSRGHLGMISPAANLHARARLARASRPGGL
jgi:polyisoprenoid-binding protein YceI